MSRSTWRYIVSLERLGEGDFAEDVWGIRELYTTEGKLDLGWSAETVRPAGATWLELMDDISRIGEASARNVVLDLTLDPPRVRPLHLPRKKS